MKKIFLAALFSLLLIGCDRSTNPVDSSTAGDVEFSEASMLKSTTATEYEFNELCKDSVAHDSLRHRKMLGMMIRAVGLNSAQVESVKVFGKILFESLQSIRAQVLDGSMTREDAKPLVQAARDQFIASVQSVLSDDQRSLFDEWIVRFWNKHHKRGPGGPGVDGPHGPGGPGFGDPHGPGGKP